MSIVLDGSNLTTTGVINSGTAVASTSGTSIDFTGIPAGVKRITVMFNGVSTSGTSQILIQIGAGSVTTTGYTCSGTYTGTTTGMYTTTSGFLAACALSGGDSFRGLATVATLGSNAWVSSGNFGRQDGYQQSHGGAISLGGTLDRVRITMANGTDTFDAGSINILYE
jgi:hypothetical protein